MEYNYIQERVVFEVENYNSVYNSQFYRRHCYLYTTKQLHVNKKQKVET